MQSLVVLALQVATCSADGIGQYLRDDLQLNKIEFQGMEARVVQQAEAAVFIQKTSAVQRVMLNGTKKSPVQRSYLLETSAAILALPGQIYDQISMNLPYSSFWGEIETFPARRPCVFNVGLATLKTTTADLVVQMCEAQGRRRQTSSRGSYDVRRSMTFALFGFLYVGIIQWLIYVSAMSALCPRAIIFGNEPWSEKLVDQAGQFDLLKQICFDNFLVNPFIYFPVFYVIKGALAAPAQPESCEAAFEADEDTPAAQLKEEPEASAKKTSVKKKAAPKAAKAVTTDGLQCQAKQTTGRLPSRLAEPLQRYARNFWEDNAASCAMWVPIDVLVFSAPIYLRMPFDHAFSFAWTMLLSYRRGSQACESERDT